MEQDDKDDATPSPFGEHKTLAEAMEAPDEGPPPELPDDDRTWQLFDAEEQSKKLPATYVNRAFVKLEGRTLRVSFGERLGDEDIYRLAIVMAPEDAYELGQLLMAQAGAAYGVVLDHYRRVFDDLAPKEDQNG